MTRIAQLSVGLLALTTVVAAQTPRTGRMMRDKLAHSQRILEALTTSNQDLLARETGALARIVQSPPWTAELRSPELRGYAESFLKIVTDLDAAAKSRDLDRAAAQYSTLTTSCYQCHRYLKGQRIAK